MSAGARPSRPTKSTDEPIFYRLPAVLLLPGMTTDDGFDIGSMSIIGGRVSYVATSTPDLDSVSTVEERSALADELVALSVFWDTAVDGSVLPEAVDVRTR